MKTEDSGHPAETIHREICFSLDRLTQMMDQLSRPAFAEHCRIWRNEKGARRLIQLAIEGERLLTKEPKVQPHGAPDSIVKQEYVEMGQQMEDLSRALKQSIRKQVGLGRLHGGSDEGFRVKLDSSLEDVPPAEGVSTIKREEPEEFYYEDHSSQSHPNRQMVSRSLMFYPCSMKLNPSRTSQRHQKRYMRGPYKNYPREIKQKVVELYKSNAQSISKLSHEYGVPIKNIKRWAENGIDRKEGAGRKRLDPQMEQQLYQMIVKKYPQGSEVSAEQVREMALTLSKYQDFKASKGWVISFLERFDLTNYVK